MMGMLDMPLLSIPEVQESYLPVPADDLVDSLFGQMHGTGE
jgi:hypothetical protein